jgi:hypothetical protein
MLARMLSLRRRALIATLGSILILGSSGGAGAAEPKPIPQPVAVDLVRLGAELDLFAAEARRTRWATAVTGLAIGSALVPTGIILLGRTDGVPQALVIGMIVGGSAQLLSVPFGFIPTRMDDIREKLQDRIAANADDHHTNADDHHTVRTIESDWRDAAIASRTKRKYVGGTLLILGSVSLTAGLTLLLAPEGILGMARKAQYTWGGVMMGSGISVTTLGARFLLEWSPEETAWEAYRTMKSNGPILKSRLGSPSVALVPTHGGVLAFATLAF